MTENFITGGREGINHEIWGSDSNEYDSVVCDTM